MYSLMFNGRDGTNQSKVTKPWTEYILSKYKYSLKIIVHHGLCTIFKESINYVDFNGKINIIY